MGGYGLVEWNCLGGGCGRVGWWGGVRWAEGSKAGS